MPELIKLVGCALDKARVEKYSTFTASEPIDIEIPVEKNHTLLKGELKVVYNTVTTLVAKEDGLARLVKHLGISLNVGTPIIEIADLRELANYNALQDRARPKHDQPSTTTGQTGVTGYVEFFINIPSDMVHPESIKAAIAGQQEDISSISLVGTWGTNSDLGTGYTITSAILRLRDDWGWICPKIPENLVQKYFPIRERALPQWFSRTESHTGAYTGFSKTLGMPANVLIRRMLIEVFTDAWVRSDAIVSEFKLVYTPKRTPVLGPYDWTEYRDRRCYELDIDPSATKMTGIVDVDCRQLFGDGITPQGMLIDKEGNYELQYSTTATGKVRVLFDAAVKKVILR